ncbi:hypothetical protein AALP_AAs45790U000200 [Arabis alpina]|uniref:Uncharacterized protein n=1 Tax=Arabis alpina TaxID=50452 RepID=A0A087G2I8_ARAAL|nr:hypothetical protein AALP_AAs45790U000200 [Arabis alpina]
MASTVVSMKAISLEINNKEKEQPDFFSGNWFRKSRVEQSPSESSLGHRGNNIKTNSIDKRAIPAPSGHGRNNIKTDSVDKGVIPPLKIGNIIVPRKGRSRVKASSSESSSGHRGNNIKTNSVDKRAITAPSGHGRNNIKTHSVDKGNIPPLKIGNIIVPRKRI